MVDGDKKFRFRNALPCNCKEALMIRVSTPYGQVCDIRYWHAPSDNHNNLTSDMAGAMCILSLVIKIAKIDGTDATL